MKLSEARSSEFHSKWGEPGNQEYKADLSDGELRERDIPSGEFEVMFRWIDRSKAAVASKMAHEIVKNDKVGYSQNNGSSPRTTLYDEMVKAAWMPAKIENKCNTDCSAFMAVVINGAGVSISKDMWTGNQRELMMNTGAFEMYLINSSTKYMTGDILWRDGHTAIVTDEEDAPSCNVATITNCKSIWLRKDGGVGSLGMAILSAGTEVEVMDEQVVWQKIKVKKTGKTGFVKKQYLG